MVYFGKYDSFDKTVGLVKCGSDRDGCMPVKGFGQDAEFVASSLDSAPEEGSLTIHEAAHLLNASINDILGRVETGQTPEGATGFALVYDGQWNLAFHGDAQAILVYKADHERGFFGRIVARVLRPLMYSRYKPSG